MLLHAVYLFGLICEQMSILNVISCTIELFIPTHKGDNVSVPYKDVKL